MAFYVVNTRREFTQAQLIHITDNGMGRVDFMEARWQALPGAKSLIACGPTKRLRTRPHGA